MDYYKTRIFQPEIEDVNIKTYEVGKHETKNSTDLLWTYKYSNKDDRAKDECLFNTQNSLHTNYRSAKSRNKLNIEIDGVYVEPCLDDQLQRLVKFDKKLEEMMLKMMHMNDHTYMQ